MLVIIHRLGLTGRCHRRAQGAAQPRQNWQAETELPVARRSQLFAENPLDARHFTAARASDDGRRHKS